MKLIQYDEQLTSTVVQMPWCCSTRASAAIVPSTHPCTSSCSCVNDSISQNSHTQKIFWKLSDALLSPTILISRTFGQNKIIFVNENAFKMLSANCRPSCWDLNILELSHFHKTSCWKTVSLPWSAVHDTIDKCVQYSERYTCLSPCTVYASVADLHKHD